MLLFKAKFLPLIRSGRKRQTVRLWRRARVKAGQRAYVPGLGSVHVTQVRKLASLAALTRGDALADGFASRRELLDEIRLLYAGAKGERGVYRVRFRWDAGRDGASRRDRWRSVPKKKAKVIRGDVARRKALTVISASARRKALREFIVARGAAGAAVSRGRVGGVE